METLPTLSKEPIKKQTLTLESVLSKEEGWASSLTLRKNSKSPTSQIAIYWYSSASLATKQKTNNKGAALTNNNKRRIQ